MSYDPNALPSGLGPDGNPPSADIGHLAISGRLMVEKIQIIGLFMGLHHSYEEPVVHPEKDYFIPKGVNLWRKSVQLKEAQVDTYRISNLDVVDSYYDYIKIVRQSRSLGAQAEEPYDLDASSWKVFLLAKDSPTTAAQFNYDPNGHQGVELALKPEEGRIIGPLVKLSGKSNGQPEEFWTGLARVTHSLTLASQAAVSLVDAAKFAA
jgi:hypothetical protein